MSHPPAPRRTILKLFFFGSLATAGAAFTYRLSRWARAADPALSAAPGATPAGRSGATLAGPGGADPAAAPAAPTARQRPAPPRTDSSPALGEEALPAVAPGAAPQGARVGPPPILSQPAWGGLSPAQGFQAQQPERITLHHEGVYFDGSTPAPRYLQHVQIWSMHTQGWPDIPYHFLIDREGLIYAGRPLDTRGDTSTAYEPQGHALIALLGKYDQGEQQPTGAQINALIALAAWIADTYAIPADTIRGHRDFIPSNADGEHIDPRTGERITCPGDNLYRYIADGTIQRGVERLLAQHSHATPREERYGDRQ